MTNLSEEQKQALSKCPGKPLPVVDPDTNARYVIVQMNLFEQLEGAAKYDDGEPDPRDQYAAFAKAVAADVDAPGMDDYDNYDAHRAVDCALKASLALP